MTAGTGRGPDQGLARYRAYLARFGIHDLVDRLAEPMSPTRAGARTFAWASEGGLRYKAVAFPDGLVAAGGKVDDDWHGFLRIAADAREVGRMIAWLETDDARPAHGPPGPPTLPLEPTARPDVGIDPALWSLVGRPTLTLSPDGTLTFVGWILPPGTRRPERWTIVAAEGRQATIRRDVPEAPVSGDRPADTAAEIERQYAALTGGDDWDRRWGLLEATQPALALPVGAILRDLRGTGDLRLIAADALLRVAGADPGSVRVFREALTTDPLPEVRRAAARSLGRVIRADAMSALSQAVATEPDVLVRAEIIHALIDHGAAASAALQRIARTDPDGNLRLLAGGMASPSDEGAHDG